jgi:hypothetical protein
MMRERGVIVDHTSIYRCVQRYAPELEKRCRPHLKPTNDSDRVDETNGWSGRDWVLGHSAPLGVRCVATKQCHDSKGAAAWRRPGRRVLPKPPYCPRLRNRLKDRPRRGNICLPPRFATQPAEEY